MKDFAYYKTNNVLYPSKEQFMLVYVYGKGEVLWSGTYTDYRTRDEAGLFKGMLIEKVIDEVALKAARQAYGTEASRLEQEFKADLFEYHGVTDNPKAGKCFGIAYDMGHSAGHSEIASYFDTLVDLIK